MTDAELGSALSCACEGSAGSNLCTLIHEASRRLQQRGDVGIGPLVAIIDREMQRLRDQLFVEQSAARSAREALAACEARLKAFESCSQPMLVPRSTDAIKEAVRLTTGFNPAVSAPIGRGAPSPWWSASSCDSELENNARIALLKLLEHLSPAASVK